MDFLSLGSDPVGPDSPAGSDVRYEPAFEELQAEIDKLSLPSAATEGVDWEKVSDLAASILADQAKDLLVAAYFGVARIHLDGYRGLALALQVLADLLENFWDTLFPKKKRMRGRLAAVEWWVEKSEAALEMFSQDVIAEEEKAALYTACDRLEQLLADLFPEPPSLGPLTRLLDNLAVAAGPAVSSAPEPEQRPPATPPPGPEPSPAAAAPRPAQPVSPPEATPVSADNAETAVQNGLQLLRRAAPLLREDNPAGPQPYRLLRLALWSPVDSLPPATDSRTLIPPPEPQTVTMLHDIAGRGDWAVLVEAAETQLSQYIFWLDLNRYSAEALAHLGPPYAAACDAVRRETGCLLQRLPGLEGLAFADGMPLADPETRDWLQTLAPGGGVAEIGLADSEDRETGDDRFAEVMDQARTLMEDNKLIKAVALLREEMLHCVSAHERFRWRLALVRLLIRSKNSSLALPHCDQLLGDIDTYRLERWDPGLALTCFKVIRAGLKTLPDETARERADAMLHRIARLDPVEALRQGAG